MRIEHVEHIGAPVDRVWDLTVDVEALPSITTTMTRVERLDDEPLDVGSHVRLEQPGQPARVWTVTELEPQSRLAWSTRALGMTMTGIHDLEASSTGTSNKLAIELSGPLAMVLGPLLRRPIRRALATENQGLKTAAEA